ncbi:(d)CMP kinase [Faecalispora anaeroviscerum]|uniref:(d)CMP kinase n=1 Tax=Faecalispora anaeroviscerum TaxID=2991836 RepID=UPI0024B9F89D|nr:(d)CMP kinase [Faecalispora anaeroviscerum]
MISIAIDGPAGAGKSTIARRVAQELGYLYVDTGALYRAIALHMLRAGKNPAVPEEVIPQLGEVQVSLQYAEGEQQVFLSAENVSDWIRTPDVAAASSKVSAIPKVREFLLSLQRNLAEQNNVVMDGRDIGTVVLPYAQVKIFLTASLEERARRRWKELLQKGSIDFDTVLSDVKKRDEQDTTREIAPLMQAADAVLVDTTGITLEQSVERMLTVIRERLPRGGVPKGKEVVS